MDNPLLTYQQRVALASDEACQLAMDALHDRALQIALFARLTGSDRDESPAAVCRELHEDALLIVLRDTHDPAIRDAAACRLGSLRSTLGADQMIRLLNDPRTKHHRSALLLALSAIRVPIPLNILIKLIVNETEEVQYESIMAIEAGRTIYQLADLKRSKTILQHALDTTDGRQATLRSALEIVSRLQTRAG